MLADTYTSEYAAEGLADEDQYIELEVFERATRNDGWWAIILLGSIIFGPEMIINPALPPFRPADFVILFLLLVRLFKSRRVYGGFMFSYRIRCFSLPMLVMIFILLFSLMVNVAIGRYPFFYKDLFTPIVFIRMIIIGSIAASFNLRERQIRQIFAGTLVISVMLVILVFGQKFLLFGIGRIMERLYVTTREEMEVGRTKVAEQLRVIGTFGNPNVFGGCLVMLAVMWLAFAINLKGKIRLMSIIVYISLSAAVILGTASRTAFIGLLLVSTTSLVLSLRRGSRIPALIFGILAIVMLIYLRENVQNLPLGPRLRTLIGGEYRPLGEGLTSRLILWKQSLATAEESLIFGVGATKTYFQLTDNGYLYTLLRTGIIGLFIYLLMLLSLFLRGTRALYIEYQPLRRALLLAFFMVLVNHALFELTGEFFWHIRYGAVFSAFIGLFCGLSTQIIYEHTYLQSDSYQIADENDEEPL